MYRYVCEKCVTVRKGGEIGDEEGRGRSAEIDIGISDGLGEK